MPHPPAAAPFHDPNTALERALRDQCLREHGCDPAALDTLPPDVRLNLLCRVSRQVAAKLAEVDARSAYVQDIHGIASR